MKTLFSCNSCQESLFPKMWNYSFYRVERASFLFNVTISKTWLMVLCQPEASEFENLWMRPNNLLCFSRMALNVTCCCFKSISLAKHNLTFIIKQSCQCQWAFALIVNQTAADQFKILQRVMELEQLSSEKAAGGMLHTSTSSARVLSPCPAIFTLMPCAA